MPAQLELLHQRGFRFGCHIVRVYLKVAALPGVPTYLARQVLKSGTSIGAHLEEAIGAQTRRDSAARVSLALKAARQTAYWLRLLSMTSLAPDSLVACAQEEAEQLVALLTVERRQLSVPAMGSSQPMYARHG